MESFTKSPSASLLDIPPELRIEVYKYALPTEIVVKAWQWKGSEDGDTFNGYLELMLPQHQRPGFMLANRLTLEESESIFWSRVVLDCTLLETADWKSTPLSFVAGSEALNSIFVSKHQADQIQRLKLSARCDGATKDWLRPFPNVHSISLYIPGGWVSERDLRAASAVLRARLNTRKIQYDLDSWMREYFQALPNNSFFSNEVVRSIPQLAEQYTVRIQIAPRRVTQSWTRLVAFGAVEEVKCEVTAHVEYDWNQDLVSCQLEDIRTTATSLIDEDVELTQFGLGKRHQPYPYVYRSPRDLLSIKSATVFDRLVFRELENRGLVPTITGTVRREF